MKKILIIIIAIFSFFVILGVGAVVFYNNGIKEVNTGKKVNEQVFVVENGMTTNQVIDFLYEKKLLKNKYCGYIYVKLNSNFVLQAGAYKLDDGMTLKEIIDTFNSGKVIDDSIVVTFIEGKRITNFAKVISKNFNYNEQEVINIMKDKTYLQELIDKYWFLTEDILNDKLYYALEGYLAPNTYYFKKDSSIKEIIEKLLSATDTNLKQYKKELESSKYSVHEILTMASIIELEGGNSKDRLGVSGVWYNRLEHGWSLGSDVTTYYAEQIEMSDRDLYQTEIDEVNDYNTRPAAMAGKLPVGPICNPSTDSIIASLRPEKHDYYYFVADKYGKTYFAKTYSEHTNTINRLKKEGLWFEYK